VKAAKKPEAIKAERKIEILVAPIRLDDTAERAERLLRQVHPADGEALDAQAVRRRVEHEHRTLIERQARMLEQPGDRL